MRAGVALVWAHRRAAAGGGDGNTTPYAQRAGSIFRDPPPLESFRRLVLAITAEQSSARAAPTNNGIAPP